MSQAEVERLGARADLCRYLAACYYQPGPEFAEERMFGSMLTAAAAADPDFGERAKRIGDLFAGEDPDSLLVDYTRLFLGPVDTLAKPYGSVWLGGDTTLMRDSTMAILALYAEAGFEVDDSFRELPDHVAAELEFLYLLLFREAEAVRNGERESAAAIVALRRRFLAEHLAAWIGPFTAAVKDSAKSPFYRELGELTRRVVQAERAAIGA